MPEEMFSALADVLDPMNTPLEVSKVLKVSPQTLCRWREQRIGPAYVPVGRSILYSKEAILQYIRNNMVTTVPVATTKQFETV